MYTAVLLPSDDPLQYNPALGFYALSPAFMQDDASAKKLNIAPAESRGESRGTW
jgi:hypothetical protein